MKISKLLIVFLFFLIPITAGAFSTSYSNTVNNTSLVPGLTSALFYGADPVYDIYTAFLTNPYYRVTYNADVINTDTGNYLSSGSTVTVGDTLKFQARPYQPEDIYFRNNGSFGGSVNGNWVNNAQTPSGGMCSNDTLLYSQTSVSTQCYFCTFVLGGVFFEVTTTVKTHATLSANPPTTSVEHNGTAGLSCNSNNTICTITSSGTIDSNIVFNSTYAKGYGAKNTSSSPPSVVFGLGCILKGEPFIARNDSSYTVTDPYQIDIPKQKVNIQLNVVEGDGPPNPPTITGPTSGETDTNYTFGFRSTDPNVDTLRYGIDWNQDGTINQWLPGSGYVSSGTQQSTSKSWTSNGSKKFNALAQDSTGLSSSWSTHTIVISNAQLPQCSDGIDNDGDGLIDLSDRGCSSNGDNDESGESSLNPTVDIYTIPSIPLVRPGDQMTILWTATDITSCTVTGPSLSRSYSTTPVSDQVTLAITQRSTYTLNCDVEGTPVSDSVTIGVVPAFEEI